MHVNAYVALGANLGDPVATVRAAIAALAALEHARLRSVSSLYRTAPVGLPHQPDFINAVALLEVDAAVLPAPTFGCAEGLVPTDGFNGYTAQAFLERLFAIEAAFGRVRSIPNAPRTLDLDLLLFGDERRDTPGLTLPHPRIAERAFVLAPLAEIAPGLHIRGRRITDLLPAVAGQRIERLPPAP